MTLPSKPIAKPIAIGLAIGLFAIGLFAIGWLGLAIGLAIELAVDLAMAWLLSAIVWLLDPGGPDVYSEAP